ncbi:MAG: flagellar hook-basal body protein [Gemmatimonadota bacterium]
MGINGIIDNARTLSYYTRLQEVVANNVANASTEAFKADRIIAHQSADGGHPVPVQMLDLRQGTLRDTGRPLDLALEGDGFLVVRTPAGERLTRGGSLRLDGVGRLTDQDGNALLGEDGPIIITGADVTIDEQGRVFADGVVAGRLRRVTVRDPGALLKEGHGRFVTSEPPVPATAETGPVVRQGRLEEANVNATMAMVDLVAIQRAYSANIVTIRTMDGVLQTITTDVGRV